MASEIPLPGLVASSQARVAAIIVRRKRIEDVRAEWPLGPGQRHPVDPGALRTRRSRSPDGGWLHLRYEYRDHFAEFDIRHDGAEVRAFASGGISDNDLASLLEGAILGGAMRLSGTACLHATLLSAQGRAVALMGQSGAGKSSLASALLRQGCRLLSDDFAAFDFSHDRVFVHPGRTKLRLWPDVAMRLPAGSASVERLYPLVPELRKLAVSNPEAVEAAPTRLHAIYLLNRREGALDAPLIEDMPPGERLAALAANLYGMIVPGAEVRRGELAAMARVAAMVGVCRLTLPDSLDSLPGAAAQLRARLFD